jgi:hypothetical protein
MTTKQIRKIKMIFYIFFSTLFLNACLLNMAFVLFLFECEFLALLFIVVYVGEFFWELKNYLERKN